MLFVLFFAQLLFPFQEVRLAFASLYMLLTLVMLFTKREYIKGMPKMISNAFAGRGSGPGGAGDGYQEWGWGWMGRRRRRSQWELESV